MNHFDAKTSNQLERSVLAALAWFDVFGYPLTAEEVRRYRYRLSGDDATGEARISEIDSALVRLREAGAIGERDGFYFLLGREGSVDERQRRFRMAEAKYRRARRFARFLALFPSVRLICVCNSLAIDHAGPESDIDFFVVVRPGSIWTTRLLAAGVLKVLGLRPDEHTEADRICLSFLVTDKCMNLERLAIEPNDPYLNYWVATLVPLYDSGGIFDRFVEENAWVRDRLPSVNGKNSGHRRKVGSMDTHWLLTVFTFFERLARRFQISYFPEAISRKANLSSEIMVSDDILKFHVKDERHAFRREFIARLGRYGLVE